VALAGLEAAGFGAVVAIERAAARVRVLASNPPYDPNRVPTELGRLNENTFETPLLNRATQGQYPPRLDLQGGDRRRRPRQRRDHAGDDDRRAGTIEVQGQPLSNDFNQDFGAISLDTALTNSVNTWFAQLGVQLGAETMFEYMDRFGFGSTPAIDLPDDQVYTSGIFDGRELLGRDDPVDIARVAFGQERLAVTPLQMAEVAAAVANGGSLMKPQIWSRVVDPDGRVVESLDPSQYSRPIDEESAAELTTAMEGVVREGTGTNAAISGIDVAGKTGTAETPFNETCGGGSEENQAWFIGFAPADDPQIAIAATVECTTAFGGDIAAPIFRDVAETILAAE
jgi:peptidoglycan glycosyltransferase